MRKTQKRKRAYSIPKDILAEADSVYRLFLSGSVGKSRLLRRRLIKRICRELEVTPGQARLWCLLADLYTFRSKKMDCYRNALRGDPRDPESNAEIAELYAGKGDQRYRAHFDRALEFCRRVDIEDSIIYTALEAARAAGDAQREQKATRLGLRRFPDCVLFQ